MASIPAPPRPAAPSRASRPIFPTKRKRHTEPLVLATIVLALVLVLRLVPEEFLRSLDREAVDNHGPDSAIPDSPSRTIASEIPGATFPGSAYFFAQNAFAPVDPDPASPDDPAVTPVPSEQHSPHILQIDNGPAALSMPMRGMSFLDQARALQCMTNAIYYEAGNEPEEGQRAVAQVILNRLASGRWPASVCGVIYQGTERSDRLCQFTFSCDGSMARTPAAAVWSRARRVAARVLSGEVFAPVGLATFYHTLAVRPPWADRVRPIAVIGAHIFYRLPGQAGMPAAYRMRYSGRETAQPGPYAFAKAARFTLPLAPPGPDLMGQTTHGTATLSPSSFPSPSSALPQSAPLPPYGLPSTTPPSLYSRAAASPDLPESTIRPEYRNSGRPLR